MLRKPIGHGPDGAREGREKGWRLASRGNASWPASTQGMGKPPLVGPEIEEEWEWEVPGIEEELIKPLVGVLGEEVGPRP